MRTIQLRLATWIVTYSRWLVLVLLLSAGIPLDWLRGARIDNSTEVWLGGQSGAYREYERFRDKYGNEAFVVIAAHVPDPLDDACLALQRTLAAELKAFPPVADVFSLTQAADALAEFRVDWRELIRTNELFRDLLLGRDGQTFGLFVNLKDLADGAAEKAAIQGIRDIVATVVGDQWDTHLAGPPIMDVALDHGSLRTARRLMPLSALLAVVILLWTLRHWPATLAVLASVGLTTLWTMGLLVASGRCLNMITIAIPSLLFVLALSGGIHLAARFLALSAEGQDRSTALRLALAEVMAPVFLSNLTTAIGFGMLMLSDMRPVIDFGLFTGLGILLSFVSNMLVIPGVLAWLPVGHVPQSMSRWHWTAQLGTFSARHRRWALGLGVGLFALTLVAMTRMEIESNVLEFFPRESRIRQDYQFIGEHLTGLYSMELDVTVPTSTGPALYKALDQLGGEIAAFDEVAKVLHAGKIALSFKHVPHPLFITKRKAGDDPLRPMLHRYKHQDTEQDAMSLRLSVLMRVMSNRDYFKLYEFIDARARQLLPPAATTRITGIAPLSHAAQKSLVDTQIRTFILATTAILLLIGLFLRSGRALMAALLPNLLPILSVFTVMVLLGIPLDTATVMIASVAIGIAADDTIHFLVHFKAEKRSGRSTIDAIAASLGKAGRAITYTSVVTTAGFAILCWGEFKPIQYFGLFTAITMITAWLGDIFILPACVTVLRLWEDNTPPKNTVTKTAPSV